MGHKKVCLRCRKAFSIYGNEGSDINLTCPECGNDTILVAHRFRPPAKDDIKKWQVVEFLIKNGFPYHHVYETWTGHPNEGLVPYPESMKDAEEFIIKYQSQAKHHSSH